MSKRYIGGLITKSPTVPTTSAAPGIWTLDQALYYIKAGTWPQPPTYIEDVFSTWLYTGTDATQAITNGIDLAGKGGLVWCKQRSSPAYNNALYDTARGVRNYISSNTTQAQVSVGSGIGLTAFNSNGFTLGADYSENASGATYASWTFREAPNFFDVVTYTGNGVSGRQIAHNLGVTPGMVIVKRTDSTADWAVWQRTLSDPSKYLVLNTTAATATDAFGPWGPTGDGYTTNASSFTDTFFRVANDTRSNASGATYVAYLFAHDPTADGIIQCGSFTTDGSDNATVNLGWEPQFVMVKQSSATSDWAMLDTMRGWPVTAGDAWLRANSSAAENVETTDYISPTSTGFQVKGMWGTPGGTSVYIAIRRGPMKTPTVGTSVFAPVARTGTGANATVSSGFVTDMVIEGNRTLTNIGTKFGVWDRLRRTNYLITNTEAADVAGGTTIIQANPWDVMDGYKVGTTSTLTNASGNTFINWMFRRAPGFFDMVYYTGTGSARTVSHSLGVAPELMLVKRRDTTGSWTVYAASQGGTKYGTLNLTDAFNTASFQWNNTTPGASTFTVGTAVTVNASGGTYVAYLFASCPGVSKVGSYTGNGSSQTINCGFSSGARFFLVKRTDSTGDWWVYDSARGITAPADPALRLNSTAAEVTSADATDPDNSGIIVNQESTCNINVNGATYIFLAIA